MNRNQKNGFTPIRVEQYVELHLKTNPGTPREEINSGIRSALQAHQNGVTCGCGNPIWVIGSALVGNACFTCITGEAVPDNDYEIDQAIAKDGE